MRMRTIPSGLDCLSFHSVHCLRWAMHEQRRGGISPSTGGLSPLMGVGRDTWIGQVLIVYMALTLG
jgi:hypothetical protein